MRMEIGVRLLLCMTVLLVKVSKNLIVCVAEKASAELEMRVWLAGFQVHTCVALFFFESCLVSSHFVSMTYTHDCGRWSNTQSGGIHKNER